MVPRLIDSFDQQSKSLQEVKKNFRPITYVEAIILTIFFNTLFS